MQKKWQLIIYLGSGFITNGKSFIKKQYQSFDVLFIEYMS